MNRADGGWRMADMMVWFGLFELRWRRSSRRRCVAVRGADWTVDMEVVGAFFERGVCGIARGFWSLVGC